MTYTEIPTTLITNGKGEARVNTVDLPEWEAQGFWPVGQEPAKKSAPAPETKSAPEAPVVPPSVTDNVAGNLFDKAKKVPPADLNVKSTGDGED